MIVTVFVNTVIVIVSVLVIRLVASVIMSFDHRLDSGWGSYTYMSVFRRESWELFVLNRLHDTVP